jgi:hypothetical protein
MNSCTSRKVCIIIRSNGKTPTARIQREPGHAVGGGSYLFFLTMGCALLYSLGESEMGQIL